MQISCFKASEESWTKREQTASDVEEGMNEGSTALEPNWRSRTQVNEKSPVLTEQSAIPAPLPADGAKVNQLQKAEELGREAYRPLSTQSITDIEKVRTSETSHHAMFDLEHATSEWNFEQIDAE